ncbi:hypothetical protein, partial [Candidatus Darwinibacter acetoxidans]
MRMVNTTFFTAAPRFTPVIGRFSANSCPTQKKTALGGLSDCRKTPAFSMVYGSRRFLVYAKIDMVMGMLDKAGNRRNQIQMVDVDMLVPEEHLLRKVDRVI